LRQIFFGGDEGKNNIMITIIILLYYIKIIVGAVDRGFRRDEMLFGNTLFSKA
jgi:hypothetical protein